MSAAIITRAGTEILNLQKVFTRVDTDITEEPIMELNPEVPDEAKDDRRENPLSVSEGSLTADVANFSSPAARRDRDVTDLQKDDPTKDPLMKSEETPEEHSVLDPNKQYVPSAVIDYYTESAMKAKKRNALPDEEFGLPRLRAYPLNDKAHVQQAIRMFGHCKDPKDRKTLASRIFTAMEKHGVTSKIGKKNALYEYAPESLREDAADVPGFKIAGFETPMSKRSKEDITREHLRVNGTYYNNIFYGNAYVHAVKSITDLEFLEYFYPDMSRMAFPVRLQCVCGGLAAAASDIVYKILKIREPLSTDFTKPLGWCDQQEQLPDELQLAVDSYYDPNGNWFRVSLANDLDHIYYCLRLYSVMGEIFLDPNFSTTVSLSDKHQALLMDWGQRVSYHYDLYKEADEGSKEQLRQIQYLFDLFWTHTACPYTESDINLNVITTIANMAKVDDQVIKMNEANDSGELITKEKCNAYLTQELGMDDSLYLLPASLEYPIIDKNSIRLAMDCINKVPKDCRAEFSQNLNKKYKEFGCTFSISVDHPYAPYADKGIILNMTQMLLEVDSGVDDQGVSTGETNPVEDPWYKRHDIVKGLGHNILTNRELGPNTKKRDEPDYSPFDSVK